MKFICLLRMNERILLCGILNITVAVRSFDSMVAHGNGCVMLVFYFCFCVFNLSGLLVLVS